MKNTMRRFAYRARGAAGVVIFIALSWLPLVMAIKRVMPTISVYVWREYEDWYENFKFCISAIIHGEHK